jgi:hypothetical protein
MTRLERRPKRRGRPLEKIERARPRGDSREQVVFRRSLQMLGQKFGGTGELFARKIAALRRAERAWRFIFSPYGKKFVFSLYNPERGIDFKIESEWQAGREGGKMIVDMRVTSAANSPEQLFQDIMRVKSLAEQQGWKQLSAEIRKMWKAGKIPELQSTEAKIDISLGKGNLGRALRIGWIKAMDCAVTCAERIAAGEAASPS